MDAMEVDTTKFSGLPTTAEGVTALKSIEGYILLVMGLHEETTEDAVLEVFEEYGKVTNIHMNLDRQTGYVKGYALIEYHDLEGAQEAIKNKDAIEIYGSPIELDFAFVEGSSVFDRGARSDGLRFRRDRSPER